MKFWMDYPFYYPDVDRPYQEVIAELIDISQAADDLGFEGIGFPEHHFNNFICNPSTLTAATVVASHTRRLRIQTAVLVLPYYHPLALAEQIALVDHISGGRLELGVARGANKFEYDRLGLDWRQARPMFDEALMILETALQSTDISHEGTYWSFPETTTIPRPLQQNLRIWLTAQSEQGVRTVGSQGRNMMTSPNLGTFAPHGDIDNVMGWYNEAARGAGDRGEVMVQRQIFLAPSEAEALAQLDGVHGYWNFYMAGYTGAADKKSDRFGEREQAEVTLKAGRLTPAQMEIKQGDIYEIYDDPILTTPERAIARFQHYERIGIDHVSTVMSFGASADEIVKSMTLMAEEVIPFFA